MTTDHNRELKLARSHWQSMAGSRASKHVQRVPLPRQQNLPPNRFMPSTLSMHKTQKATDSNTIVHPCKSVAMAPDSRRYHDNTDLQGGNILLHSHNNCQHTTAIRLLGANQQQRGPQCHVVMVRSKHLHTFGVSRGKGLSYPKLITCLTKMYGSVRV